MILDDLKIRYKLRISVVGQILILILLLIFIITLFKKLRENELKTLNSAKEVELIKNVASKINKYSIGSYNFDKLKKEYNSLKDTLNEIKNLDKLDKIWKDVETFNKQTKENNDIIIEVMELTDNSILQSNSYIEQVAKKLAHPQQRKQVTTLQRMVIIGANSNTTVNGKIKVLFYRMSKKIEEKEQLILFLNNAIERAEIDVVNLQNTPFAQLPVIALENNNTIKELTLKFITNSESNYKLNENIQKNINLFITELIKESVEDIRDNNSVLKQYILVILFVLIIISIIIIIVNLLVSNSLTSSFYKMIGDFKELAKGNLVKNKYLAENNRKDELGDLEGARIEMTNKISEVINNVIEGANTIALAGESLNLSAQNITQGANEQASSSEQISASMEQMGANISENNNNANETSKISVEAAEQMKDLSKVANESLNSISQISDKISIVNDISFQTNILALNAAVEAARAGVHGKGFAVVASEVQKLAERSKNMANEIDEISHFSIKHANDTKKILDELVPKIEKIAILIKNISHASNEQNSGVKQVNTAITGFNDISQSNASISEELASSAEELASSAEELKQTVSYFKIEGKDKKNDDVEIVYSKSEDISFNDNKAELENETEMNKYDITETKEKTKDIIQVKTPIKDKGYDLDLGKYEEDNEFESF